MPAHPKPRASFLASHLVPDEMLALLPRETRIAIRSMRKAPVPVRPTQGTRSPLDLDLHIDADSISDPYGDAHYLASNTVDPDFDLDGSAEFGDSTDADDLHGLTIVEPGHGNIRRWLRGRDII